MGKGTRSNAAITAAGEQIGALAKSEAGALVPGNIGNILGCAAGRTPP